MCTYLFSFIKTMRYEPRNWSCNRTQSIVGCALRTICGFRYIDGIEKKGRYATYLAKIRGPAGPIRHD